MSVNFDSPSPLPLAILPGLICDARLFADQLTAFRGAMVIGEYYAGARSLEAMAAYALARLPDRFSLLGHSMGARVALEVLRIAPQRVARLALASTGVHPVRPGEAEARGALLGLGRTQGMAALVAEWLPPMIGPAGVNDAALVARLTAMAEEAGIDTFEAQVEALLARREVTALLPTIACPTLVITGNEDRWSPPEQHRAIAAAIPGASLTIVPDAGHMLPAEAPTAFNAALQAWLDQPDAPL
ncbi:alpha/beta fold hydrolase [Novosphingobium piscinae]|uniref:Alpha/beta fold hydrolase n=1 Tax=Novosphingobium piscinae TaxID=1507448 RepID=A0A7X1FVJ3_9SPHN|nr:alpha/beta fold hydrolase [Novosphingobium piscinae]MBC2667765.1 alpha/beta fold hydrolase [Novosphingobium piscinae]